MNRTTRHRIDIILSGIALVGLAVCVFLLADEKFLRARLSIQPESEQQPIGQMIKATNDVRRKLAGSIAWFGSDQGERLFANDQIFCGDNSKAEIMLGQGTRVHLGPNSLIALVQDHGTTTLNVEFGLFQVSLAKDESLIVMNRDQRVALHSKGRATKIQIQGEKDNIKFGVIEGEALLSYQGEEQIVKKSEVATLKGSGEVKLDDVSIALLKPSQNTRMNLLTDGAMILFQWHSPIRLEETTLEIAEDAEFSKILKTVPANGSSAKVGALPGRETLYWRVRGVAQGKRIESLSSTFKVRYLRPVELSAPAAATRIALEPNEDEGKKVRLQWHDDSGFDQYRVQVSTSKNFQKPLHEQSTQEQFLITPQLKPGRYYWRVVGEANVASPESELRDFEILAHSEPEVATHEPPPAPIEPAPLPAPTPVPRPVAFELSKPDAVAKALQKQAISTPPPVAPVPVTPIDVPIHRSLERPTLLGPEQDKSFIYQAPGSTRIHFKWQKVSEASSYEFEASQSADFSSSLFSVKSKQASYLHREDLPNGRLYWRVRAIGPATESGPAEESQWSETGKFNSVIESGEVNQ